MPQLCHLSRPREQVSKNKLCLCFDLAFIQCELLNIRKGQAELICVFVLVIEWTKRLSKENTQDGGVPVYIASLSSSLTYISCSSKDRERIQQEHIMYLDWALLHWCSSLLCVMGAPGLSGLVGQMGSKVPGPIWVLNGLSPVCLPSWFRSHVTWPCSELSPDCTVQGVHIRCVLTSLPTTNTAHVAISFSLTQQAKQVHVYFSDESDCHVFTEPLTYFSLFVETLSLTLWKYFRPTIYVMKNPSEIIVIDSQGSKSVNCRQQCLSSIVAL